MFSTILCMFLLEWCLPHLLACLWLSWPPMLLALEYQRWMKLWHVWLVVFVQYYWWHCSSFSFNVEVHVLCMYICFVKSYWNNHDKCTVYNCVFDIRWFICLSWVLSTIVFFNAFCKLVLLYTCRWFTFQPVGLHQNMLDIFGLW